VTTSQFPGFAALFDMPHTGPATDKDAALARTRAASDKVLKTQANYQPIYGNAGNFPNSARQPLLDRDCALVTDEFSDVLRKGQVRVLDVGCNAGYAAFRLAETFPKTIGFDINPDNIALCRAIRDQTGSHAQFHVHDLLKAIDDGTADLENVDCLLLLNVAHQLIFVRGLDYVQALIARIMQAVDVAVIELANRRDYIPHGKDHLLPIDPFEILSACENVTITLVQTDPRPLYILRRTQLTVGDTAFNYHDRQFSDHPDPRVSRKYYYGTRAFAKMIRYGKGQDRSRYDAEVAALRALDGMDIAPALIDAQTDAVAGTVLMERLFGLPLLGQLAHIPADAKPGLVREMIRIAAALSSKSLYQNDFSAHNLFLLSDGSLRLIDFEQAGDTALRDPFGFFLWLVHDLMAGQGQSYRNGVDKLVLANAARGDSAYYPPVTDHALPADLRAVLDDARNTATPWHDFIIAADKTLA